MLVRVRVKPGSRQSRIEQTGEGTLLVWLRSPASQGRANEELLEKLAEHFGVPRSQVHIRSGRTSRSKLVQIG